MLYTALFMALLTLLAAWMHLRSHGRAREAGSAHRAGACPRCRARVPEEAPSCAACGVPLQAFEVVSARAVAAPADGRAEASDEVVHGVVRKDLCVGCGTCVEACPEPGAIRLEGKQSVIDLAHCVGHGLCAQACPVGAIFMSSGGSVQRIEVPDLDSGFESNVRGLYIVGELGGRGLIKNAINEGRIAVEQVARDLGGPTRAARAGAEILDVVVVGAGPAGISAGLEAARSGLRYQVLERGTLADSIRKYPRHKVLLAEPVKVPLYGQLWVADASKESLLKVWERIIADTGLKVQTGCEVTQVSKVDGHFRVEAGGRYILSRRVVLALGRRGTPRRLGVPGEDLSKVLYDIIEMEGFAGRRVLVVGGGDSAVESAVGLSRQPGARIALSYRGGEFSRIKPRNKTKLDDAAKAGRLQVVLNSQVRDIQPGEVLMDVGGKTARLPNDDVIIRIGGEPPFEFLKRAGVRMVSKDVPIVADWDKPAQKTASSAAGG